MNKYAFAHSRAYKRRSYVRPLSLVSQKRVEGVFDSCRQTFFLGLTMEMCDWEERSVGLARFLVAQATADLDGRRVNNAEKLKSLRHVAGFSWNRKVVRAVGSRELSAITRRAVINSRTKEFARALKVRSRRIWFAPPELSVVGPHEWWNLIATSGHSGRASEEAWARLFTELNELLILAPSDLAELGAD